MFGIGPLVVSFALSLGDVHIVHCFNGGCPTGAPAQNDMVVRELFVLSNNPQTKLADWVAYRVTRETIGASADLNRGWATDEFLSEDETLEAGSGRRDDYHGAHTASDYDRGHQAPLASFAGTPFWRSTNIYSNITPQRGDLNQGPWRELEEAIRDAAYAHRAVYVVTGPLFEREMPGLGNAGEPHSVPSGYWKVVLDRSGNAAAFVFDQETPRSDNFCDHQSKIEEIEARSTLDLFVLGAEPPEGFGPALGCPAR